ncbi:unnamed protein product [Adineta ricciae]|uniref:Reverse transcriptase n=1 Tax=Adineta ricciae TaxID=249248 RepID=A0A815NTI6_ADIRI|nr:unnamed protein product [Adineta ricciae]
MVKTRAQKQTALVKSEDQIEPVGDIRIEEAKNLQQAENIENRPLSFVMTEKLVNTILSTNFDKLPKFGGKNTENIHKWLTDITNELNLLKLDDPQKLSVIQTFLVDDARRWLINHLEELVNWNDFVRQIRQTFSLPLHRELALRKVGTRDQGMNETVLHYYNDMMELFDTIDTKMTDQYKVAYLKAGVKASLKKEVMRREPNSPEQFLEIAQTEEKLDSSINLQMDSLQISDIDSFSAMAKVQSHHQPQQEQQYQYQQQQQEQQYQYQQQQHEQQYQHQPQYQYQHQPQQRKGRGFSKQLRCFRSGANDGMTPVFPQQPSLIFIPTWIQSKKISTMLDTGATSSLITMSVIRQLGYQDHIHKDIGEIMLGDSKTKIVQYGWIYLNLNINNLDFGIRARVVDHLTTDLILGMDFMRKYKVEIKIMQNYIVLYHSKHRLHVKFEKVNSVRLTTQCCLLPKRHTIVDVMIEGITNGNKMLMNVVSEKTQRHKRIRLCDGFVDIRNNLAQLTVYNPTTRMVNLPKSMLVGTIDQLAADTYCSNLILNTNVDGTVVISGKQKSVGDVCEIADRMVQHLEGNDQLQLGNLLQQHKLLFDTTQPRTIKTTVHHVINTGDHPPVNAKPYFKSMEQRKNIQQEIDKMLKAGIIIPSTSPWSSPVVLLKKPNGEFRFIIDYRRLNAITKKDSYPQPTVEELLQRLGGHSWFTKLDLKSGYYQIPIQQSDKEKTAFVTQDGLYQFEVLPMGLMNAPPTFQRMMNNIIGYNRWDYVLVYLDDILIFSKSFEEHMDHLRELFAVLSDHRFTLNPSKCSLAKQSIDFLSHTITKDSIVPSKERVQAILEMPQPTSLAQANKFIGKIGWYRKFIPGFAKIAAPIHKVTNKMKQKKKEFYWHDEQIQAVNKLKQLLTQEPLLLKYPYPTALFILSTDASDYAIGGTLKQVVNGNTHYNYFLSRLLTATERNYPTIEREALAMFWCMEKLQNYLGGRQVMIISDHKPLQQFHLKFKINSKRITEWLIKYQDILPQITEVKYRKGSNHGDADGMSRPDVVNPPHSLNAITRSMAKTARSNMLHNDEPLTTPNNSIIKNPMTFDFSLERIRQEQLNDSQLIRMKQQVISGDINDQSLLVENDVLYKLVQTNHSMTKRKAIYIPATMQDEVIQCFHDHPTAAHFGVNRTWLKMKNTCYWRGMKRDIQTYIKSCDKCARFNISRIKPSGHLNPIESPIGPLEIVSMDFWGPTTEYSINGNKYVLVITDYYTKYVVAQPLPDNSAITAAQCFVEQFVFKYGVPRRLITDQGVHFKNELMKKLTTLLGTHHIHTSAYHPQGNGLVERFNGTFHPQLAKLHNVELNNWDEYLAPIIYAYNTGIQNSTGYSPFQLMFGRNPNLPLDHTSATFTLQRTNDYWYKLLKCMKFYGETSRQRTNIQQKQSKQRFDKNRKDPKYNIHDLVLWKIPGYRSKLTERYSGPFEIINKKHPSYTIQDTQSLAIKQVHISDLKAIYSREGLASYD